jgi:antitoxin MazE
MKTEVQKWGNSLAIRIPRAFARETRIDDGTEVDLSLQSGRLVITPVQKKRYNLNSLLAKVRNSNRHSETDWGDPVGGEAW